MKRTSFNLAVVGGGAAGMMAAALAAERGLRVAVFEKNEYTGKKLGITGKGRCNLTNCCEVRDCLEQIPRNGRFLYSAMNAFPPEAVMAWFEAQGVPLKVERGNRVFPVSDKARDIVEALRGAMRRSGVRVYQERVSELRAENGRIVSVVTDGGEYPCGAAILATGGISYPLTGSTGDGYAFAKRLGHTIIALKPSLVPLVSVDDTCAEMQGLSLRNVSLSVYDREGKKIYEDFGELLFTHFGISGPLTLSASAHMRDFEHEKYSVKIDLKPALDEKKLDLRLLRDFDKYRNRAFENALGDLLNRKMIPVAVRLSGIAPDTQVNSITRDQRRRLLELLKAFPVEIAGPRPAEESIVTSGGISVREIDPKTMESKLVNGLYFAGEIIDVDGYTGGFNLQIAWATARAAALAAAEAFESPEGK